MVSSLSGFTQPCRLSGGGATEAPRISAPLSTCRFNKVHKEKAVGFFKEQHQNTSEGAQFTPGTPLRDNARWEPARSRAFPHGIALLRHRRAEASR